MAIRLGFETDEEVEERARAEGYDISKKKLEEAKEKYTQVKLRPERVQKFLNDYDCVVVNDFGDIYHKSEEERRAENKFYDKFKKIQKYKHKYRKIDEFVTAMRDHLACLDAVAESQNVYDPDKFKKLFLKDKIRINGLTLPVYRGKDKKRLGWDYITEFILGDEDPKKLLPDKDQVSDDDFKDPDEGLDPIEKARRYFTEEQIQRMLNPPEEVVRSYVDFDKEFENGVLWATELTKKENKQTLKTFPELVYKAAEIRKRERTLNNTSLAFIYDYDMTESEISDVGDYEENHNFVCDKKMPKIKGDMMDDKAYEKYMRKLEEYENEHIKVNYNGSLKTQEEIRLIKLKEQLQKDGWNIRALYNEKEDRKRRKKLEKKQRSKEEKLRRKLSELEDNRSKGMLSSEIQESSRKKGKKKKKDKKKDKDKLKKIKKDKSSDKIPHKSRKQREDELDEFLLAVNDDHEHETWQDYEDDVLDMTWDAIMEQGERSEKNAKKRND